MTRFVTLRTVFALILREMTTTYGRSPGGYVWAIIQPVAIIALLAAVFSYALRAPSLGTSFLLFYATGILPLRLFQDLSGSIGGAIQANRALMSYPRVTFVDVILARAILSVLTQVMVNVVVLAGIFWIDGIRTSLDFTPILQAYGICVALAVGVGVLNCYLTFAFPVWKTVWGIVTKPLLLVSGVFYIFEDVPSAAQQILWFNPLIHITGLARQGFYGAYHPGYINLLFVASFAIVPLFFGVLLLSRFNKDALFK